LGKIEIDWDLVDSLLESGNDGVRISSHFGIEPDTFYRRCKEEKEIVFSKYAAQKKAKGQTKLIAKQYEKAMTGDNSMLIWVGKQMCGQRDNPSQDDLSVPKEELLKLQERILKLEHENLLLKQKELENAAISQADNQL